jgi:hypothetical protein
MKFYSILSFFKITTNLMVILKNEKMREGPCEDACIAHLEITLLLRHFD